VVINAKLCLLSDNGLSVCSAFMLLISRFLDFITAYLGLGTLNTWGFISENCFNHFLFGICPNLYASHMDFAPKSRSVNG
jgi:hypothetical protein